MTGPAPAELRIAGRPGVFVAEECTIDGGVVTASGRWRERCGLHGAEFRWREHVVKTWPIGRLEEVRWLTPAA